MKQFIFSFFVIAMMFVSPKGMYAFNEGEHSVITIMPANHMSTTVPNRTVVPIAAYYDGFMTAIVVSFNDNIGVVETTITNLETGEIIITPVDAYAAPVLIPISGDEGQYSIFFELSNGVEFYGHFEL